ncbi:MAG: hypothetical protein R3B09_01675 [Nannocystaceae bacterium]
MTLDEQLRLAASHAVQAVNGRLDPRRARSELLTIWANGRPKDAKALPLGDAVVGVLRDAAESTLRSPPYLLIQATAVVIDIIARPFDPEAGKAVMSEPALVVGRYLSADDDVKALRRLYETPEKTTTRTLVVAGATGGVGLLAGLLVSRLFRRGEAP